MKMRQQAKSLVLPPQTRRSGPQTRGTRRGWCQTGCMSAPSSPSCGSCYVADTVRMRSSGSCMAKILSLQECRNALDYNRKYNVENVSTDATYVRETYSSYYPPGCVLGSSYYTYNSNRYSTRNCDGWNKCVCETTKC